MSRGALEVLRHMHAESACKVCRNVCDECKAYDEAIAQVEALVKAARSDAAYLEPYHKAFNSGQPADWMEAALCAKHYHCRILEALQPFTPGQDSEGGGNG